jgi:hypothetical protein
MKLREMLQSLVREQQDTIITDYTNITLGDIQEYFIRYHNFSDGLTAMQHAYLANILFCIFLLFCLFTLVGVFLGEQIISYFQLETKYPRLAKLFYYRKALQRYYFISNSILMFIVLLFLIYLNTHLLFNT